MPIFALPFFATLAFARLATVAVIVLGFMIWWPLGLAALAFTFWSGRMGCGYRGGHDRWQHKMERMQSKMDWMRERMSGGPAGGSPWGWGHAPSSGNRAFDDYRAETLRRLEDEQREFKDFLERLRFAKDKTEFDAFMNERRNRPVQDTSQGTSQGTTHEPPPPQN